MPCAWNRGLWTNRASIAPENAHREARCAPERQIINDEANRAEANRDADHAEAGHGETATSPRPRKRAQRGAVRARLPKAPDRMQVTQRAVGLIQRNDS